MHTGAQVGLENDFIEVNESVSSFNICAVLKNPLKRNITICLMVSGGTAVGKILDCITEKCCVRVCVTSVLFSVRRKGKKEV